MGLLEFGQKYGWIISISISIIAIVIPWTFYSKYYGHMETSDRIDQLSVLAEECNATEEIAQLNKARFEIGKENITGAENIAGNVVKGLESKRCLAISKIPVVWVLGITIIIALVIFVLFRPIYLRIFQ